MLHELYIIHYFTSLIEIHHQYKTFTKNYETIILPLLDKISVPSTPVNVRGWKSFLVLTCNANHTLYSF